MKYRTVKDQAKLYLKIKEYQVTQILFTSHICRHMFVTSDGCCIYLPLLLTKTSNLHQTPPPLTSRKRIIHNATSGLRFKVYGAFAAHQNLTDSYNNVRLFTDDTFNVSLYTSEAPNGSQQIKKNANLEPNIFNARVKLGHFINVTQERIARIGSILGENIADVSQRNETVVCPDNPPSLIGHKAANITEVTKTELMKLFPDIKDGHLIPSDCTPRQKLALIFPYRNRFNHLHVVLNNLIPLLIRQLADVRLFVIEQADQSTFNKGVLLNAGFSEADKVGSFDCYIVHDVDLIPLNDNNLYRCGDRPRHFTVAINKFNYRLFYGAHFGGAVSFSREQFLKINGYSNLYFGWGSEDDDMYYRVHNKGFSILRYNETIARYDMIKHTRDEGNQENPLSTL
ncbi:hypothetical protein Btru_038109 [Bulinus truncatus]|nr:hypothetical protein Btru_038109 [Bulinus truncatus]